MPESPVRSFGPPQPDATQGGQKVKNQQITSAFVPYLVCEQSGSEMIHTVLVVHVSADDVSDPGEVGRGAGEHGGLLIHDTSNRAEAGYTVNFPRSSGGILAH